MLLLLGIVVDGKIGEWVLNFNKFLYGIKKASENWFELLKTALKRGGGCNQSHVDPCILYINTQLSSPMLMIV